MTTAVATAQNETRIRPGEVGDVNFIASTWKQSAWRECPFAKRMRWGVFAPEFAVIVQRILGRSAVLVACDPNEPDDIFGYMVCEPSAEEGPVLHTCYTKPAFRKAGIQRALLAASGLPQDLAGVTVTFATRAWFSMPPFTSDKGVVLRDARPGLEAKFPGATHNLLRGLR